MHEDQCERCGGLYPETDMEELDSGELLCRHCIDCCNGCLAVCSVEELADGDGYCEDCVGEEEDEDEEEPEAA